MADAQDLEFLKRAIELSKNAPALETCFRVGAVLVDSNRQVLATGYTLELGEAWHAEAVAIKKALDTGASIKQATIYCSLEPCSTRKSGKKDCCALLIEEGIARVVFALSEPPLFVICEGTNKLKKAKIQVDQFGGYEDLVRKINQHLF